MILDTERLLKQSVYKEREKKIGQLEDTLRAKKEAEKFVIHKANSGNGWGKFLKTPEFELKLRKIAKHRVVFEDFTFEELKGKVLQGYPADKPWHHKRLMVLLRNDLGTDDKIQICLYPRELIPENSIMAAKEDFLPNPEFMSTGKTPSKFDISPNAVDWAEKPSKESALYKYFYDQGGVAIRGWREVLLICLQIGVVSLVDVEREFGPAENSPEWAQKVYGHRNDGRPW
jgi:hypothetical protein